MVLQKVLFFLAEVFYLSVVDVYKFVVERIVSMHTDILRLKLLKIDFTSVYFRLSSSLGFLILLGAIRLLLDAVEILFLLLLQVLLLVKRREVRDDHPAFFPFLRRHIYN